MSNEILVIDLVSDDSTSGLLDTSDQTTEEYVDALEDNESALTAITDPNRDQRSSDGQMLNLSDGPQESDEEEIEESYHSMDCLEDVEIDKTKRKKTALKATFGGAISGGDYPLWSVQFNPYLSSGQDFFAAVGGNRVTIYRCIDDHKRPIRLIDCFADNNVPKGDPRLENYFSVCWSFDQNSGNPLVICGGNRAIIRIIDCTTKTSRHLLGHCGAINDLKTSPHDHNLILSSSEDHSIRLWNIKTCVCVARFWGEFGHRDQVICSDFYIISDRFFVSAGMDHSINIWPLDSQEVRNAIKESHEPQIEDKNFEMRNVFYPVFSTRDVHHNYIDCVQFFGKWLLSKSLSNKISLTQPDFLCGHDPPANLRPISQFSSDPNLTFCGSLDMEDNDYWFVKFSMNFDQSLLAIGNSKGTTYLWDMAVDDPREYQPLLLKHRRSRSCIRQTCFSNDSSILIGVSESASIYRWNISR